MGIEAARWPIRTAGGRLRGMNRGSFRPEPDWAGEARTM
jgi:hypothetical protein